MTAPIALVTGAARRIGAAVARRLHQEGYYLVVHYHRSEQDAAQLVTALNGLKKNSAIAISGDLSQPDTPESLIQQSLQWAGRLDVLVNNASLFSRQVGDWDNLFAVNVKAPFLLSQAAFLALSQAKGCVVNITDIHATRPLKGYSMYCQAKAALWMQTKSLAKEFAPTVRVNAIAPGAMAWPEGENALTDSQQQKIIEKTPLKRHGESSFIAQAVLDLVNQPFITGQSITIDGGRSI